MQDQYKKLMAMAEQKGHAGTSGKSSGRLEVSPTTMPLVLLSGGAIGSSNGTQQFRDPKLWLSKEKELAVRLS